MSKPRSKKEAVFNYHEAISSECAAICSAGAVLHEVELATLDKRILLAPPELLHTSEQMVTRLTKLSEEYCTQFERTSWRPVTPPILIRDVNAATLWSNKALSVAKLSDFDRDNLLSSISRFLHLALEQWSAFELENAQIRHTQAQIKQYGHADDLYKLRESGYSFRVNAVTEGHTRSQTENLNQLLVLVGQAGTPTVQTRHERKQRSAKLRVPRISFSGGSVIADSKDLKLLPVTLY